MNTNLSHLSENNQKAIAEILELIKEEVNPEVTKTQTIVEIICKEKITSLESKGV